MNENEATELIKIANKGKKNFNVTVKKKEINESTGVNENDRIVIYNYFCIIYFFDFAYHAFCFIISGSIYYAVYPDSDIGSKT
jgi:hypothetical protein